MPAYVALLRAVNVTGYGKLLMTDLAALCTGLGFQSVRTYIASGNVVFTSHLTEPQVKAALDTALGTHMGKPVGIMVRTPAELAAILAADPFPEAPGNQMLVIFLDAPPPPDALTHATRVQGELCALGTREIYVWYRNGVGESRLNIPAAKTGTARNRNTVAKLAQMASELAF